MRNYRVILIKFLFIFCLTLGFTRSALSSEITNGLKSTINGVIEIIKGQSFKADKKSRRAEMRKLIDPKFSYQQMSMRALDKNWKNISQNEQKEFVDLFRKLLENSYASKLEAYGEEKINYIDEKVKGQFALVKTKIIRRDGNMQVDYKLIREDGVWKVFDFVIEGVSMIKNYRSQFNRIIKKESYEALKDKMTVKIKGIENDDFRS